MEQRKILILTGNFGMGHRCVAEAIRQQLAAMHIHAQIQVLDLMDALFPNSSALMYRGFAQMVHYCPSLYNQLNRITGRCSTLPMQSWIADKMKELLKDAEIVVSTFPLCAQFAAMYKRKYHASIALYTYITDIGAQDEWIVPDTDLYFVGAQETKLDLLYKGVAPHRIHVCGIPVRQDFLHPVGQARGGKTEILLMGGGLGLLPSAEDCLSILSRCDSVHVTVITGKNQALYDTLRVKYPEITVIGYTEQVAQYMQRADVLVTKSGGATTFEAIHSETPLYILQPFLVQEFANARYIEQHRIGCVAWKKSQTIAQDILALAQDSSRLHEMKRNMHALKQSWEEICPVVAYNSRREPTAS